MVKVGSHKETFPVKVKAFRRYMMRQYYEKTKSSVSAQSVQDALGVLEVRALFDGPEVPVFMRRAEHEGSIYLDLCNDNWEAVRITTAGWQVVAEPPVKFRRALGMLALPNPVSGGSIKELRPFVNDTTDNFPMLCAWLVQALRPRGPYPVGILHGEQGSAKSTTAKDLRALVDPNSSPLRTEPRNEHDLMIAANNAWCVAIDHLSGMSVWQSDSLCRLSTGGGFSTRELYTDADEVLFDAQRPILLNGIVEVATRGDLLDRAIIFRNPRIPKRRPEDEFWAAFEKARPSILGALLDGVSAALRNLPNVQFDGLPRMADFALWATAAEQGFGIKEGTFIAAYTDNRSSANDLVLESSSVASVLTTFIQKEQLWMNTASELLKALNGHADEATQRQQGWPKNGRSLSNKLRRLAPNLRAAGVAIEFDIKEGHQKTRKIHIEWQGNFASAAPQIR